MTVPLASVVTPTWQRHDLLTGRCIPSVQAQDYPAVEHVIVSDGPDPELAAHPALSAPGIRFEELPEHDHSVGWGHRARLRGIEMAKGDFIAYLDDDNAYRPSHLSQVIAAMERDGADFGYAVALFHGRGPDYPVGSAPPVLGQVDTSLIVHRRELLEKATWEDPRPALDWYLVEKWLAAGASYAFVPVVTLDYHFSG